MNDRKKKKERKKTVLKKVRKYENTERKKTDR